LLNQKFLQALLLDFEAHGREAIEECRKQSPLGYVKVLGHLVPREMKVKHSQSLKSMSDEELDAAIEYLRAMLAAQAGDGAKVIEGTAETVTLPAPKRPLTPRGGSSSRPRPRPRPRARLWRMKSNMTVSGSLPAKMATGSGSTAAPEMLCRTWKQGRGRNLIQ
jgi:hypothetical protein